MKTHAELIAAAERVVESHDRMRGMSWSRRIVTWSLIYVLPALALWSGGWAVADAARWAVWPALCVALLHLLGASLISANVVALAKAIEKGRP